MENLGEVRGPLDEEGGMLKVIRILGSQVKIKSFLFLMVWKLWRVCASMCGYLLKIERKKHM